MRTECPAGPVMAQSASLAELDALFATLQQVVAQFE
jgi:hypothetical protein